MKPNDISGKVHYGTWLEYILKGTVEPERVEFWAVGHSQDAQDYYVQHELAQRSFNHKFGALQKSLD
jgi:hypothetical protein